MNTVFRLIWNSETRNWAVAPETARARTKGTSVNKVAGALALMAAAVLGHADRAAAQTVPLPAFDPTVNDNRVGSTVVSGGATVTLQGSATQITPGIAGKTDTTLPDLFAAGMTTDPRANPNDPASLVINRGSRTQIVTVPDPISGGTRTVATYANANIVDTHATAVPNPYTVFVNGPTNDRQYIDTRLGEVDATGGRLNIAIGSLGGATDATANNMNFGMVKQSSLVLANGTGTATSTVEWQGTNNIEMGSVGGAINAPGPGPTTSQPFTFYSYKGTFTAFDGSSRAVNSAADLQAYNSFLIARMQAGALNPNQYEAEFTKAFTSVTSPISMTNGPPLPDEAYAPIGIRAVIQANGANAQGIVAAGARLDVTNSTSDAFVTPAVRSGVLVATNGGTVINNGQVSSRRGGNDSGYSILAQSGGHGVNNGVINGGFVTGLSGNINPVAPTIQMVNTVFVQGVGSTFTNNASGIINTGGAGSAAIRLEDGGTGTNSGVINLGGAPITTPGAGVRTDGVLAITGSQFTNLAGGLIYLGRQPQYTSGAVVPDVANNATPLSGMTVVGAGSVTNAGTVTIGSLTQGSSGMFASGATGVVLNSGVINVNGAASAEPTENQGINVQSSTNVTNSGTINVNGVNGVGLKLTSVGATRATSSGTINVSGGLGATGLRNYGIWSEGANSIATLSGAVNLSGNGGIGVHARDSGDVVITGAGNVNFMAGTNQIGYFMHGAGSTITNTGTAAQNVSTAGSTLFRIEEGAVFNGGTGGSAFTASGSGSTAFKITGAPSTFNSGNITLNLTGANATGVLIEGGAVGTIANTATINQSGIGSVVGIVDGQKHGLSGASIDAPNPATTLFNQAAMNLPAAGALAFIARNQGTFVNQAPITMTGTDATGVHVLAGGVLDNRANIIVANGTGVNLEGTGSIVSNNATVRASDGVAALHVHDGGGGAVGGSFVSAGSAHTVLIGSGATGLNVSGITLTSLGGGSGIENAAEIGNITLANTTIHAGDGAGIRTATSLDPASNVIIDVSGAGTGLAFRTAAAGPASGNLQLGAGYQITGNGAGSTGILANTTGAVTTAAKVEMTHASAGAALVAGTASSSFNTGDLSSASTSAAVVDLSNGDGTTFTNQGNVRAVDSFHNAVLGSSGNDSVNLIAGAMRGVVAMGAGADTVHWSGGSLDGSIEMGAGENDVLRLTGVDLAKTYHLDGGSGAGDALTVDGVQHRGGSFSGDDLTKGVNLGENWETINFRNGANFTLTDSLRVGGSTINIDATSQLNAGALVLPVIRSTLANDPVTVNNAGTISLANGSSGTSDRLTIVGNYMGQNGRLAIDTVLNEGEPNSLSDKLVLDGSNGGARASGITALAVNYWGGGAVSTNNGIRVVDAVNGATTDAGSFTLGNRVAAGAYEYVLVKGGRAATGGDPNDQNWYLRNVVEVAEPPTVSPPVVPSQPLNPPVAERPNYRAEVPLDMVVPAMVQRLGLAVLGTYHDRAGEDYGTTLMPRDPGGEIGKGAWGWARTFGQNGNVSFDGATKSARFNSFVEHGPSYDLKVGGLQAGIDVHRKWRDGGGRDVAGIYLGAGRADAQVQTVLDGAAGSANTQAVSFGGYWTRLGAPGWYLDTVVQGTHYADIKTSSVLGEKMNTDGWGILASIEGGYPFAMDGGWKIEPQAQLIYQRTSISKKLRDRFGMVEYGDTDAFYGRVGGRLTKNWMQDTGRPITAWARANVWHHFGSNASTTFASLNGMNRVSLATDLGGTWGQVGLGLSAQVTKNTSAFASIDYNAPLSGGRTGSAVSAQAGLRIVW